LIYYDTEANNKLQNNNLLILVGCTKSVPETILNQPPHLKYRRNEKYIKIPGLEI
jgi:hypothetical protein